MTRTFSNRDAVEAWTQDVAPEITSGHARALADLIIDKAHKLGLRYGDDWEFLDMPESEWNTLLSDTIVTVAEEVAAIFNSDGTIFEDSEGRTLDEVAEAYSGERSRVRDGHYRWVFPDGSILAVNGVAWDFGFADCWCFAGNGHTCGGSND